MQTKEFSTFLEKLDSTQKRLEIIEIISILFKTLDEHNIACGLYLALGRMGPHFADIKFNMAEKMMLKAIAQATNQDVRLVSEEYSKLGDLGDVFLLLNKDKNAKQGTLLTHTYQQLKHIAELQGAGSQDKKIETTAELLRSLDEETSKYIIRIILGTTRLGFTDLTVIAGIAKALSNNKNEEKSNKVLIEGTYMKHPDIGKIAEILKLNGIEGIQNIDIMTGTPIFPQKCQRVASAEEAIEKMGDVFAEYKFDGTRVQLHFDRDKVDLNEGNKDQIQLFENTENKPFAKTFTRNLEETTHQFPELIDEACKSIDVQSAILDGEVLGFDKDTGKLLPFQEIMQRKRKHNIKEFSQKIPIKYYIFDILYLNGKTMINTPLAERRAKLTQTIKQSELFMVDEQIRTTKTQELNKYFEQAQSKGLEGLVIKKANSTYKAGARDYTWVKLKVADVNLLRDTIDCVILGYYFGKGVRANFGVGGFLAGIYDKKADIFLTITKVGTGLTDDNWRELKRKSVPLETKGPPKNLKIGKGYTPDVWLEPKLVVELGADEISKSSTHSLGYALRFPRLIRFRADKDYTDTTQPNEIRTMYELQIKASI